jgi:phosphinothricin acetyltransferase
LRCQTENVLDFILRPSVEADVPAITAIYAHWVQTSPATFEIDPPDADEMARRRADILARNLPYLVVESKHDVAGYAYATPYRPRAAYRFSVEDSVYLHPDYVRQGLGRRLLTAVVARCEDLGYRQMVAVIGGRDNLASISLHQACGFTQAGILRSVGFKFGRWEDTVLMQRSLGAADSTLPQS